MGILYGENRNAFFPDPLSVRVLFYFYFIIFYSIALVGITGLEPVTFAM